MALMKSPAGDMVITVKEVEASGEDLKIIGKFGAWEAQLIFPPDELKELIGLAMKGGAVGYVLKLPFKKSKKD